MSERIEAIGIFSFGAPAGLRPNLLLTACAVEMQKETGAPIIADFMLPFGGEAETVSMPRDGHLSTPHGARFMIREMKKRGLVTVVLICAPQHRRRVERDFKVVAREVGYAVKIVAFDCPLIHGEADFYDPESEQYWTRNRWIWWIREAILLAAPWSIYKWGVKYK